MVYKKVVIEVMVLEEEISGLVLERDTDVCIGGTDMVVHEVSIEDVTSELEIKKCNDIFGVANN